MQRVCACAHWQCGCQVPPNGKGRNHTNFSAARQTEHLVLWTLFILSRKFVVFAHTGRTFRCGRMEMAHRASRALIVVGAGNVLNAFLAGCIQAEKSYHTDHFTNTHWITVISLFAGMASALCPSFTFCTTSFVLAITVDIFALAVCSATMIADFFNVLAVCNDFTALTTNAFVTKLQVRVVVECYLSKKAS